MKILKQLIRQPLKSIFGTQMMAMATLAICVGLAQVQAADFTAVMLENSFDTVGIMKAEAILNIYQLFDNYYGANLHLAKGAIAAQWLDEVAPEYPEIIKQISKNGLASAYIHDVTPLSYYTNEYLDHLYGTALSTVVGRAENTPQNCAMFEITLESIGDVQIYESVYTVETPLPETAFPDYNQWKTYYDALEVRSELSGATVELTGKINRVLSLEESFKDPTGMTLKFTLGATTYEGLMEVVSELERGQRYLVYGLNYKDDDWQIRMEWDVDEWDYSKLHLATEREKELWAKNQGWTDVYARYDGNWMSKSTYNTINTVSLNVKLSAYNSISYMPIRDENGILTEIRVIEDKKVTDVYGNSVAVSVEEFGEYYKIPSIVPLNGIAEEFLASEEGIEWKAALERDTVNNHAFPVIGVEDLDYVAQFIMGEARIVEGRKFTDWELSGGVTVCVISQELAAANNLHVGDAIHPNFYTADENLPYQIPLATSNDVINPSAGMYFSTTPLIGEMEYTIVGIYRSNEPWAYVTNEENHYAFTPNTIFVPKASVPAEMQYSSLLQFQTVVLHNGQMENFAALMNKAGFGGFYHLDDQGYSQLAKNFSDYRALSRKVLLICTVTYGMVALLYLLLFPGSQRKTMLLMEDMGAGPGRRSYHVFASSLVLLLPATVLGTGAGLLLWDGIIAKMKLSVDVLVEMELNVTRILAVSALQFFLMGLLSAVAALIQARPHKLAKRR